jgi:hypothetical protein
MSTDFAGIEDLRSFCEELRAMAKAGEQGAALDAIARFVLQVVIRESSWATVFSSPELDALCQELGRLPPGAPVNPMDRDRAVFLVTALNVVGGHTRVLMDLIHADTAAYKTVLVSNLLHDLSENEVREILHRIDPLVEIELAPNGGTAETFAWLQRRLAALRSERSYILQHHFDAAITAAVQPELTGRLFYYHNCDHSLALGVHLPHATHVDFNGKLFHHCRHAKGLTNNVFWPLVAEVSIHRADLPFLGNGRVVTATAGGLPKFDTSYLLEWIPYRHDYKSLVPRILSATGGEHIHFGPLTDDVLELIRANIASAEIDQARFTHVGRVDDIAAELVNRCVDLYIGSFPLGGGRVTIEVMGAGIPLLLHNNYASVFFTDINEVYPGALTWRDADELTSVLGALNAEMLADHADRARAFYAGRFTLGNLRDAIAATLGGTPTVVPAAPVHQPNALQRWLDQRAALPNQSGPYRHIHEANAAVEQLQISTKQIAGILLRRFVRKIKRSIRQ